MDRWGNKRIWRLALVLAFTAAGSTWADQNDDVLGIFNDFFGWLTAKHEVLESLAMPAAEVRGPPGTEDLVTQAVVILNFKKAEDQNLFVEALRAENVPFGSFPDGRLFLFSVDLMIFVMQDAIGL